MDKFRIQLEKVLEHLEKAMAELELIGDSGNEFHVEIDNVYDEIIKRIDA